VSLHAQPAFPIPTETERVARAAFPKGTLCLHITDALGVIFCDEQFAALYPKRGQPAEAPARLALVTLLQFVENLSDRQAADAVRGRIDWKYALALELTDPGFDHTVLSEFRTRLVEGKIERLLLDTLLERFKELDLLKTRGRQRTDSTHVMAAVRSMNRLERVAETLRAALNELAVKAPQWLQTLSPPEWFQRYGSRVENYQLPKTESGRQELARVVAADGEKLLAVIDAAVDQSELAQLPAIVLLRRLWAEQYTGEPGNLSWREVKNMPSPAGLLASPYDPDARYSSKREIEWIGYKVHLTETCDADRPHLIVNIETTPATTPDDNMAKVVHESLAKHDLLPAEHLVDKGYTDSHMLVESKQQHGVRIIGPVADDPSWQARSADGFDKSQFVVDWDLEVVTCPAGKQSISWLPNTYPKNGCVWEARFARKDCTPCPLRARCTKSKIEPRIIGLQAREYHEALQQARQQQQTEAFRLQYAARAGIESTHEQALRRCGLRRSRYIGSAKTRLQHAITAAAINLIRTSDWWISKPHACTRRSRFAALEPRSQAA
jgi:transposase